MNFGILPQVLLMAIGVMAIIFGVMGFPHTITLSQNSKTVIRECQDKKTLSDHFEMLRNTLILIIGGLLLIFVSIAISL